ncbi:MAG: hypothetical protein PHN60_01170 [Candidatus Gracilibacteria bacterium]|nr:hypothetical protein [Candidatus Gracilibacteria bacterium]
MSQNTPERGFLCGKFGNREGFETVATLSTKEIGKCALNGTFCCKAFFGSATKEKRIPHSWESREGFETIDDEVFYKATRHDKKECHSPLYSEENRGAKQIGKKANDLAFRHKEFFEARVRLKDEIDSTEKRIPHSQNNHTIITNLLIFTK